MDSRASDLHMLFFPFMAQGHMLPMVDMAKLFAARGARITILTTHANATIIRPTIDESIHLHIIPFLSVEFGLPEGCENHNFLLHDNLHINFFKAVSSLRHPFDSVLTDLRPDCVVSDMFLPWTYHIAVARGIPRLLFHGTSNFTLCAGDAFERHCLQLVEEDESFVLPCLPCLPHQIEILKNQVMDINKLEGTSMEFLVDQLFKEMKEADPKSYGTVVNSFYELEPEYVNHYHVVMGKRSWNVGLVSLCNKELTYKLARGADQPKIAMKCLKWLNENLTGSVVYICFGGGVLFSMAQQREIALGLEASKHEFIWVVRNEDDDWVPEGYEERIEGRGIVIRGWAPQLLILNHGAVGGFVTHCGWNSSLEGICAGLPMVTWPLYADQFFNEKLLVEVLNIGVPVGSKVYSFVVEERPVLEAAIVEATMRRVMGEGEEAEERRRRAKELADMARVMGEGEEAEERRRRAKELADMARRAVEKGGSSYEEIDKLMEELVNQREHLKLSLT